MQDNEPAMNEGGISGHTGLGAGRADRRILGILIHNAAA
jgi:hypothetical protein